MEIKVKGFSSVLCKIDTIDFNLSLTTYASDTKTLIEKEKIVKEKMLSSLDSIKDDIRLVFLSSDVRNDYRNEHNKSVFIGYRMEERYRFSIPYDVSSVVSFLSLIYKNEDSELFVSYSFSSSLVKENKEQSIEGALSDARNKADAIAKALNKKIVSIKEVRLDGNDSLPYVCASDSYIPIEDSKVTSEVEVVFEAK